MVWSSSTVSRAVALQAANLGFIHDTTSDTLAQKSSILKTTIEF